MATKHFKSKKGYQKWLAYGHIHGEFAATPGNQRIFIHRVSHHVRHKPTQPPIYRPKTGGFLAHPPALGVKDNKFRIHIKALIKKADSGDVAAMKQLAKFRAMR